MNNNKQIIINAPDGQIIDLEYFNQTNNIRFIDEKPTKIEFPKEWELKVDEYYYIDTDSDIKMWNVSLDYIKSDANKLLLPSKPLAEQMLIFTQLITMRERYREIEKLNNPELKKVIWDGSEANYCVYIYYNLLECDTYKESLRTFSFKKKETLDEFVKNFGDMILQCKDILG